MNNLKTLSIMILLSVAYMQSAALPELRVSEDGRTLETTGGQPFLYLGDTAWELFHKLDRAQADYYLSHRANNGYSVIQAVILAEMDGLRTPNPYGHVPFHDLNPERPNEAYFEHVDYIVNKAEKLGLYMGLLPTWGDKLYSQHPGAGPIVFNPENAYTYGKFLGNRYAGKPVIWILGGDRNIDSGEVFKTWRAMAMGIKEANGDRQLITYHPRGASHSYYWLHNEDWLDFNSYQSGHDERGKRVFEHAAQNWMLYPAKPFIDSEPAYEDIAVRFWEYVDFSKPEKQRVPHGVLDETGRIVDRSHFKEGFFTDYEVRIHGYWNLFSGAAGYTYGNNAIWQMWQPGRPFAIPCLTDWREALDRPGSLDIKHIHDLLLSRNFGSLVPDQSLVYGPNFNGLDHLRCVISSDLNVAMIYFARAHPATIMTDKLSSAKLTAWWYNPRNGMALLIGNVPSGHVDFSPPESGHGKDWVLVIENEDAFSNPPGQLKQ